MIVAILGQCWRAQVLAERVDFTLFQYRRKLTLSHCLLTQTPFQICQRQSATHVEQAALSRYYQYVFNHVLLQKWAHKRDVQNHSLDNVGRPPYFESSFTLFFLSILYLKYISVLLHQYLECSSQNTHSLHVWNEKLWLSFIRLVMKTKIPSTVWIWKTVC